LVVQLSGVLTALVTPFSRGSLDVARFSALVERQLAAGIAGLVPCGTTGETPTLEADEWTRSSARPSRSRRRTFR
jgi:4-hydroxy-tetrahydrodipicolinate synthase